jgi:hypothetical protein
VRVQCFFKSMLPVQSNVDRHAFTPDGFRDAVERAKKIAKINNTSADVNIECGSKDIFLLSCPSSTKGATCDTRFSGRPHGGLGDKRKRSR